jgi:hypothetical protein
MNANEVADFIIDIYDQVEGLPPKEQQAVIEGGINRLWRIGIDEFQLFKIYCTWCRIDTLSGESAIQFAKLINTLEEFYGF